MSSHWEVLSNGGVEVSTTPEGLWKNACKYFKWCEDNPIKNIVTLKSGKEAGKRMTEEHARPYTIKGLCLHCGINEEYLKDLRNSKNRTSDYTIVVERIMYVIWVQIAEHAITGVFNPIFSARMLNLDVDDTPVSAIQVNIVAGLPAIPRSENEILEKLEIENGIVIKRD